jgi:hypothetical protein
MLILHCPLVTVIARATEITVSREPGLRISRADPVAQNPRGHGIRPRETHTLDARLDIALRQTIIVPEGVVPYLLCIVTPSEELRLLVRNEGWEWVASEIVMVIHHRDAPYNHTLLHRAETTRWYLNYHGT